MAKPDGRLYGLAVYLAFWLDREDLADAVEDYAEYLENPDGRCYREPPEEFGRRSAWGCGTRRGRSGACWPWSQ